MGCNLYILRLKACAKLEISLMSDITMYPFCRGLIDFDITIH